MKIVKFLRRDPIPTKVVARDDLEGEKTIAVRSKNGNVKWTDVSNACFACSHLTALDEEGNVLRELTLDPNDPELDPSPEVVDQKLKAQAEADANLPGRSPIISVDVPALVRSIADAMKDVAQSAAEQNAQAHATGMRAMGDVVSTCLSLMQRVEQRLAEKDDELDELAEDRRALLTEGQPPEASTSTRDQLIELAMQQAMGGPAPNGSEGSAEAVDPVRAAQLVELLNAFAASQQRPPAEG